MSEFLDSSANERHAIYFAPARSTPWWAFGDGWLRRDGPTELTAEPRRYGFHATLKAPFRLAPGTSAGTLRLRLRRLADTLRPVALGPLQPVHLDGFVALVPTDPPPALGALAQACVAELDDLRAPPSEAEFARRRPEQLDPRGRELLQRYGYPHVLERFRFHMTLSGPVDAVQAESLLAQLAQPVARLNAESPLLLDRLCLFVEPAPGAPFERVADEVLPA